MKRQAAAATGVATPASAVETVIATVGVPNLGDNPLISGVVVDGVLNITPGATATAVIIRIRRTNLTGAVVGVAQTHTLANPASGSVPFTALDTAPVAGNYVVTLATTGQSGAGAVGYAVVTATAA
jgi:hypothetical protein